jgi:hypothetical protein
LLLLNIANKLPEKNLKPMPFIKAIILFLFISSTLHSYGQNKFDTTKLLDLHQTTGYMERNSCWGDSIITFAQTITYQNPNIVNDQSIQILKVRFLHGNELKDGNIFDVEKDNLSIRCSYERHASWNGSKNETTISGQVRVILITEKTIELEFNLTVTEPKKGIYVYKGIRKSTRKKVLADIPVIQTRQ